MKDFRSQFTKCLVDGLVLKRKAKPNEFSDAELTVLFPIRLAGTKMTPPVEINVCGKFGGDCHSGNFECRKLRGFVAREHLEDSSSSENL